MADDIIKHERLYNDLTTEIQINIVNYYALNSFLKNSIESQEDPIKQLTHLKHIKAVLDKLIEDYEQLNKIITHKE